MKTIKNIFTIEVITWMVGLFFAALIASSAASFIIGLISGQIDTTPLN